MNGYNAVSFTPFEVPTSTKWNYLGSNDSAFKAFIDNLEQGWISAYATWTRTGATTFTVSGDLTGIYSVGDKVRLKQGGAYKYFFITAVSYDSGTGLTTVTVTAGIDYTLAVGAITDNYYSKAESPNGFPKTFNYTPTWSSGGTLPTLGDATLTGKFKMNLNTVWMRLVFTFGSTSSFGTGVHNWSAPITASNDGSDIFHLLHASAVDAGVKRYACSGTLYGNSTAIEAVYNASDTLVSGTVPFTWATGDILVLQGEYLTNK